MAEYVTHFKADEGVSRENFNSRIEQINLQFDAAEEAKGAAGGVATLDDDQKLVQMPSAADIGAVKQYLYLSEINLAEATATADNIVAAMEDGSVLFHPLSGNAKNAILAFPVNYSLFRVTKRSSSYAVFEVFATGGIGIYLGYYNGGSTNKWSGWKKVYTEDSKPTPDDIGAAKLNSDGRIEGTQVCSSVSWADTSRVLTADDIGKTVVCYNTSAITITVPAGLPFGSEIEIVRRELGAITIAAASGVTIVSAETARTIKNRYGAVCLKKIYANGDTWLLIGDLG